MDFDDEQLVCTETSLPSYADVALAQMDPSDDMFDGFTNTYVLGLDGLPQLVSSHAFSCSVVDLPHSRDDVQSTPTSRSPNCGHHQL